MAENQMIETTQSRQVSFRDELSVSDVLTQVRKIQEIMHSVMKENEHYGVIPGCKKPSLLKPGAEKLGLTFRLAPSFEIDKIDIDDDDREYIVKCTLRHINTDAIFSEGVGSCSTKEAKYRYRIGEVKPTGKPVPKEYWNERDQNLIGGKGFGVKKIDNQWQIVEMGEKVEHDNPADYYNTVLKMAKKRAHVDAMLTATAASDIFTQDVEDLPDFEPNPEESKTETTVGKPVVEMPKKGKNENELLTTKQLNYLGVLWGNKKKELNIESDEGIKYILNKFGYESRKDVKKADVDKIVEAINDYKLNDELPF